jgi:hypothetical protein
MDNVTLAILIFTALAAISGLLILRWLGGKS